MGVISLVVSSVNTLATITIYFRLPISIRISDVKVIFRCSCLSPLSLTSQHKHVVHSFVLLYRSIISIDKSIRMQVVYTNFDKDGIHYRLLRRISLWRLHSNFPRRKISFRKNTPLIALASQLQWLISATTLVHRSTVSPVIPSNPSYHY